MLTHTEDTERENGRVRITVMVQNRSSFDTRLVTGREIKESAKVPPDYALYRKAEGGNEPVDDDALVELRNGDHFFARPSSNAQ
jgi:hypothetical protein